MKRKERGKTVTLQRGKSTVPFFFFACFHNVIAVDAARKNFNVLLESVFFCLLAFFFFLLTDVRVHDLLVVCFSSFFFACFVVVVVVECEIKEREKVVGDNNSKHEFAL